MDGRPVLVLDRAYSLVIIQFVMTAFDVAVTRGLTGATASVVW